MLCLDGNGVTLPWFLMRLGSSDSGQPRDLGGRRSDGAVLRGAGTPSFRTFVASPEEQSAPGRAHGPCISFSACLIISAASSQRVPGSLAEERVVESQSIVRQCVHLIR